MHHRSLALAFCAVLATPALAGDDVFLVDNLAKTLHRTNTGDVSAEVLVANLPASPWVGLAPSDREEHLFLLAALNQEILTLREADGEFVSTLAVDRDLGGIAFDREAGVLYGMPRSGAAELFQVDLVTGVTTLLGDTQIPEGPLDTVGLAWDASTGRLYATTTTGNLYEIDPAVVTASLVGNLGLASPFGLAFNPRDEQLYVVDATADEIYRVDRTTALVTMLPGQLTAATFATGMAFSSQTCQPSLGFQGPGQVFLSVCGGDLTQADEDAILFVEGAPPAAPVVLIVGVGSNPMPMGGGTLVPGSPARPFPAQLASADGELRRSVPGGLGTDVVVQAVVLDPGGGNLFSNAVEIDF